MTDTITTTKKELTEIEQKMIRRLFLRQWPLLGTMNFTRMEGLSYGWILAPFLKQIYKTREGYLAALKRNSQFFNTNQALATFIMGLTLSMEKENAENPDFDETAIEGVKVSLMGPFAGIGDSFFYGTLRVIATGMTIGLALQGNILGPIVFLLVYNIPNYIVRYLGCSLGYRLGASYITKAAETGLLTSITKSASILGLMMVGCMSATMVSFKTNLVLNLGGSELVLQEILDSICVGILPMAIVLTVLSLLRKKVSANKILIGLFVFAFMVAALGII